MANSKALWAVAILIFSFGAYCVGVGAADPHWPAFGWALLSMLGCVGLIRKAIWSQYVIYLLAAGLVVQWAYLVSLAHAAGWPYSGTIETIISLVPGAAFVFLCIGVCVVVRRAFRDEEGNSTNSQESG
ncbi:MAG: hypothetical protein JSS20_02170 [Proteobacteria bacterium]|nr:hypothetical protein [Pseudomonadota bacterium]